MQSQTKYGQYIKPSWFENALFFGW